MAKGRRLGLVWAVVAIWGVAIALALVLIWMLAAGGSGPQPQAELAAPAASLPPTATPLVPPTPVPYRTPTPTPTGAPPSPGPTPTGLSPQPPTPGEGEPGLERLLPEAVDITVIGYSVSGRPLEVFRFGAGEVERMIVAGIHGGYEWNTIALADALINHLHHHPELIPPEVTLYILRSLNPDGEARSRGVNGHDNDNGVDLNRNWPSHWQADWPRGGCWTYTPVTGGPEPGSEPETQALMAFLLGSRVDALISYHSAVLGIFAGGQPPDAASLSLAEAAAAVSPYPYPPIDTGCRFTGQLIDWASDNGIAALDVELRNHRDTDFEINLEVLRVLLAWRR